MFSLAFDRIGDFNPQLFRELKGRYIPRNLLIATAVSLAGQFLLLLYSWGRLPHLDDEHRYCTGAIRNYGQPSCLRDAVGNIIVDWKFWGLEQFLTLSIVGVIILWVVGAYLLISDLDREERRGTLNFIRLTPQSASSLLLGKLIGVPCLVWWVALLAVPIHLWFGAIAQIPGHFLAAFYLAALTGSFCWYSVALVIGLKSTWLNGFQAWLGGGGILVLLMATFGGGRSYSAIDALHGFIPSLVLSHLVPTSRLRDVESSWVSMRALEWFHLPVGDRLSASLAITLLTHGLISYWLWQISRRCFRNPEATLLGKRQSYGLTLSFTVFILGFAFHSVTASVPPDVNPITHRLRDLLEELQVLLVLGSILGLGLIAALLPQRPNLQDWARYRHQWATSQTSSRRRSLIGELIWSEKSPAIVAIAVNLAILGSVLLLWVATWPNGETKFHAIFSIGLSLSIVWLYAAIAQLLLLMRTPQRGFWALGGTSAAIVLPLITFSILSMAPDQTAGLWLLSPLSMLGVEYATAREIMFAFLGQLSIIALLNLQFWRQMRLLGASSSKALLRDRVS